jgi:hypothetical protein
VLRKDAELLADVLTVFLRAVRALATRRCSRRCPGAGNLPSNLGLEVVPNGNTRAHPLDPYSSMVVEKLFAGPGAFVNFRPASLLAPGLSPTVVLPAPNFGDVRQPVNACHAA